MGEFSVWHLLILAAVFVLFFGSKKLPDAARSFGRSLRILKAETRGLHDDNEAAQPAPAATPVAITPPVSPQPGIVAEGAPPVAAPADGIPPVPPVTTPAGDAR